MRETDTEEATRRQTEIRNAQSDLFSLQSDKKRLERTCSDAQAEIRRMQLEISHLKASVDSREIALRASVREVELIDEEIMRVKKHMSSL